MHDNLVAIIVVKNEYTLGYLKYGDTHIWAEMGSYDVVANSIQRKHLHYLSKYNFYEKI